MDNTPVNGSRGSVAAPSVDNSYQLAHFVIIVGFSCFAVIAFALRIWARRIQSQAFALSDYILLLGFVSSIHCAQ